MQSTKTESQGQKSNNNPGNMRPNIKTVIVNLITDLTLLSGSCMPTLTFPLTINKVDAVKFLATIISSSQKWEHSTGHTHLLTGTPTGSTNYTIILILTEGMLATKGESF